MLRILCMTLATLLIVINSGSEAIAEKRVALVIGNSGYKAVTALQNPANDSADIARALEVLDFEVEHVSDLTFDNMRRTLRSFSKKASAADVALVFYAGHGIEVDGQNYLIPVDARLESSGDVDFEALPLNLVMGSLNGAKKLKLVLLDACRNNPFIAGMKTSGGKRAIGRGLARVEPSVGTLVGFAAKEGTTASDGDGRNSPYTKALLEHLDEPGLEINLLFRKVRDSVLALTNGQQEPFTYGSLPGRQLYLKEASQSTKANVPGGSSADARLSEAGQVWQTTQSSQSIAVLETFAENYTGTPYAAFARARIAELKSLKASPVPTVPSIQNSKSEHKKTAALDPKPQASERNEQAQESNDDRLVRAVQQALNAHQCGAGSVDGKWGRKGVAAAKRFSDAAKLVVAYVSPSRDLLRALESVKGPICRTPDSGGAGNDVAEPNHANELCKFACAADGSISPSLVKGRWSFSGLSAGTGISLSGQIVLNGTRKGSIDVLWNDKGTPFSARSFVSVAYNKNGTLNLTGTQSELGTNASIYRARYGQYDTDSAQCTLRSDRRMSCQLVDIRGRRTSRFLVAR